VPRAAVARAAGAVVLGAAMLLAANFAVAKRLAWTPGGYGIVFSAPCCTTGSWRAISTTMPDKRLRLCPYRRELPATARRLPVGEACFTSSPLRRPRSTRCARSVL